MHPSGNSMKSTNSRDGGSVNRRPLKQKRGNSSTTLMPPPRLHQPLRVETPHSQAPPSSRQAPLPAPASSSRAIPTTPSSSDQAPTRHVSPSSEAPLMPPAPFPREMWDDKLGVRLDTSNKKRSTIWAHWTPFKDHEGVEKARCIWCGSFLKADGNIMGVSSLKRHIFKICQKRAEIMKGQMRLNFQPRFGLEMTIWKYDLVKLRQKIAIMIILDELPFIFVEKEGFKGVMKEASTLFKMPCRKTIRADCLRLFLDGIVNLKSFFKSNCIGRVSITTDCWTSIQNFNYICITAHFVGVDWKLHRKIMNFCRILSHKGVDIADVVGDCLEKWGLKNICSVTVDNASANDTTIQCLKEKFFAWGTSMLQGKYLHMRCVAHVTNLIVGQWLSELGMSVRRVREAVRFVRSSPARFARFEECIVFSHIAN
ncbi:Putative AC transposase [Linum grandiflorum]